MQQTSSLSGLEQLTTRLPGKVVTPADSQYKTGRLGWDLAVNQRPKVIVFAETAQDVVDAMNFARQNHLPVAVLGTGHGMKRAADDALLLNLTRMTGVEVHPDTQSAWVVGGTKWGQVLEQAQKFGLAPLLGSSPDVGAVGYSLGGGLGWLGRKYGLSVDSILRMEVVTADGVLRSVNQDENSELFWAIRGGGGGFGVVTGMEIRLYPVTQVYAGNLLYPPEMAGEVIQRYRQWVSNAPDELSTGFVLMNFPPLPEVPPMLSGKSVVIVRGCYTGAIEEGEKIMDFWRSWQQPMVDDFKPLPYIRAAEISQDPVDPLPSMFIGGWLQEISEVAADALIQHTFPQGGPPLVTMTEVRHAGGVISRVDPDSNAYSNRESQFCWMSLSVVMSPEMGKMLAAHYARLQKALEPCLTGKLYPNFSSGDQIRQRTQDAFGDKTFRRLQEVKAKYDPENRFDFALNIPPAK